MDFLILVHSVIVVLINIIIIMIIITTAAAAAAAIVIIRIQVMFFSCSFYELQDSFYFLDCQLIRK